MAKMWTLVTVGLLLTIGWANATAGEEEDLQLKGDLQQVYNEVGGEVLNMQLRHTKQNKNEIRQRRKMDKNIKQKRKNRQGKQKRNKKKQRKINRQNKTELKNKRKKNKPEINKRKHKIRRGKKFKKGKKKRMRKNKKKAEKTARKNKKGKQRKKKKMQKRKKGLRRQITTKCNTRAVTSNCLIDATTALDLEKSQVANFIKQVKRAIRHASLIRNKEGKNGGFSSDANHLTNALGGNTSAPSCGSGNSSSSAAAVAKELAKCSSTITISCAVPTLNTSLIGSGVCNTTMYALKAKNEECKPKKGDAACTCWAEAAKMKDNVNSCNAKSEAKNIKSKKDACKNTFGNCKNNQDEAVGYSATCIKEKVKNNANNTATTAGAVRKRKRFLQSLIGNRIMKIY